MPFRVIADSVELLNPIKKMLSHVPAVGYALVGDRPIAATEIEAFVIKSDVSNPHCVNAIRASLSGNDRGSKRVFLFDRPSHRDIAQAYALGATHVLFGRKQCDIVELLAVPEQVASSDNVACVADVGRDAFASMFAAVASDQDIDNLRVESAGRLIASSVAEQGLAVWLDAVRHHHEGTFQHCLLVTCVAAEFAIRLGMNSSDIDRLSIAAMYHDIGKAAIPIVILDKPGRLTTEERSIVEEHPITGYEALARTQGIESAIVDAVRHHHEFLDGSGYPDRLQGNEIGDLVRLLTISDVFAALIEERSYKPPMNRVDAYQVLCSMSGKLEKALLREFRHVALGPRGRL
jgi:putative nucleotidyltransferase with HDIG domain